MANIHSVFDRHQHQENLHSKLIVALERVSEIFRILLWEKAKNYDLSPLQIQLLIFVRYHRQEHNKVTFLSQEFNMTKATISDAIKTLIKKGYLKKNQEVIDKRSFFYTPTESGEKITVELENFANPLADITTQFADKQAADLYGTILKLIGSAEKRGLINKQRMCMNCQFYSKQSGKSHCNLLKKSLNVEDLRIDCEEFRTI